MTPILKELPKTLIVFLLFLLASNVTAQQPKYSTVSRASDIVQVIALVDSMEISWNTHDVQALANLFHANAIWVLFNSEVLQGRESIEAGHALVHKTILRNSVRKKRIDEKTFLSPDVAVVRICDNLTGDERYPNKVVESRGMLVITKRNDVWRIGWGQTTRPPEFSTKK
jgi:uncharacterized protein (TIGR02246 family)